MIERWHGEGWEVVCGDALRVMMELPDASVDALVTDPPYSSGGAMRGDRTASTLSKYVSNDSGNRAVYLDFAGDTRDQMAFFAWCTLWYSEALRAAKDGAAVAAFTDWRQQAVTSNALQAGGWVYRGLAVWDKTPEARPQRGRPRAQAEFICWGSKGPMQPYEGAPCLPGVWTMVSPRADRTHIAQKPLALMQDLVKLCPPGGLVLDPFGGSGTTAVAALREGRRVLVIEVMPENARVIVERLRAEERGLSVQAARDGQMGVFDLLTGVQGVR